MKRKLALASLVFIALALVACDIPFNYSTSNYTVSIPGVAGYAESIFTTPSQTQAANIAINTVTLNYSVNNSTSAAVDFKIYIGLDATDNDVLGSETEIISLSVPPGTTTGSVMPNILALAVKQPAFVIGAQNLSGAFSGPGSVVMTYSCDVAGSIAFLK
jgi:hypothetical protein